MRNLKLTLEYDGAGFAGWQAQPGRRTVESEVGSAIRGLTGEEITVHGSGRTDAGAHALGQVASFRYPGAVSAQRLVGALNARLPADVSVLDAEEVGEDFHARHSARWRHYRYTWLDRPSRPALDRARCWHLHRPLDEVAMAVAARVLVGRHDWSTFCSASEPAADRVREMREASVIRRGRFVDFDLVGTGFLRGLVRSIAGGLAEVGLRRHDPSWLGRVLEARERSLAPRTAPARGLALVGVEY